MMQILRTDWTGRGKWGAVARAINAIGRLVNDIQGENGIDVEYRGGRLVVSGSGNSGGPGFPWEKLAFGWRLAFDSGTGNTTCTIFPGAIRIHGVATVRLGVATDVVLTSSPSWVYLQRNRAGGGITVHVSATDPDSTAGLLRIPLYRFDGTPGSSYKLGHIARMGDVHFDSPM